jgi:predicted NodU family carbamoyl transferase
MLILGLSSFKHDTAAALFEDGIIKAAIEEEKLIRSRSTGLPVNAIRQSPKVGLDPQPGSAWRVPEQPGAIWTE